MGVKKLIEQWNVPEYVSQIDDLAKFKDYLRKAVQIKEMDSSGFF